LQIGEKKGGGLQSQLRGEKVSYATRIFSSCSGNVGKGIQKEKERRLYGKGKSYCCWASKTPNGKTREHDMPVVAGWQ